MTLKLTLKPNEYVVVNGCVIRNGNRRNTLVFENKADIVREHDLLKAEREATPVARAYFLIQTALTRADLREKIVPLIQEQLAALVTCFSARTQSAIMEAANYVSLMDYYKALKVLRPVLRYEAEVLGLEKPVPASDDALETALA